MKRRRLLQVGTGILVTTQLSTVFAQNGEGGTLPDDVATAVETGVTDGIGAAQEEFEAYAATEIRNDRPYPDLDTLEEFAIDGARDGVSRYLGGEAAPDTEMVPLEDVFDAIRSATAGAVEGALLPPTAFEADHADESARDERAGQTSANPLEEGVAPAVAGAVEGGLSEWRVDETSQNPPIRDRQALAHVIAGASHGVVSRPDESFALQSDESIAFRKEYKDRTAFGAGAGAAAVGRLAIEQSQRSAEDLLDTVQFGALGAAQGALGSIAGDRELPVTEEGLAAAARGAVQGIGKDRSDVAGPNLADDDHQQVWAIAYGSAYGVAVESDGEVPTDNQIEASALAAVDSTLKILRETSGEESSRTTIQLRPGQLALIASYAASETMTYALRNDIDDPAALEERATVAAEEGVADPDTLERSEVDSELPDEQTSSEPESGSDPGPEPEPEFEPDPDPQPEPEPEPEPESDPDPDPESEPDPDPESEPDPDPQPEPNGNEAGSD